MKRSGWMVLGLWGALMGLGWAQPPEEWIRRAQQAEEGQRWSEAEGHWRKAIGGLSAKKEADLLGLANFFLGRLLFEQKRLEEAVPPLKQALQCFTRSRNGKGVALANLQLGLLARSRQQWTEAEGSFRAGLKAAEEAGDESRKWELMRYLAEVLDAGHRWPEATEAYHQILEQQRRVKAPAGEMAETLTTLGHLETVQSHVQEAFGLYQEAVSLLPGDPQSLEPLGCIARLHMNAGRYPQAQAFLDQCLKLSPDHYPTACNRAYCLEMSGHQEEALAAYRALLARAPLPKDRAALQQRMIQALFGMGKEAEGRALLSEAYPDSAISRARVLDGLKRPEEAIGELRRALEAKPEDSDVANELGVMLLGQHRYPEARDCFQKTLLKVPGDPTLLTNLAETYLAQAQYPAALTYLLEAVEGLRPKLPESAPQLVMVLNNLAAVYEEQGQWEKSLATLREAVRLGDGFHKPAPIQGTLANSLGHLYAQLGRWQEALGYYDKALALRRAFRDRRGEALTLNNQATALKLSGQARDARSVYEQAGKVAEEVGDPFLSAILENNLAELESEPQRARAGFLKALEGFSAESHPLERGQALSNLAQLPGLEEGERKAWADESYALLRGVGARQALMTLMLAYLKAHRNLPDGGSPADLQLQLLEDVVRGLPSRLARGLVDNLSENLEWAVLEQPGPEAIFEAEERVRALGVLALTQGVAFSQDRYPVELRQRLSGLEERMAQLVRRNGSDQVARDLAQLKREYGLACEEAQQLDLAQGQLKQARSARLPEMWKALGREEAVVEYLRFPTRWVVLLLQNQRIELIPLGNRKVVEAACEKARRFLSPAAPAEKTEAALAEFSQICWRPVGSRLDPNIRRLVVIPKGQLYAIPFAALPCDDQPLVARWEIEQSSSATAWLISRATRVQGKGQMAAALGTSRVLWNRNLDPLPATLKEVEHLSGLFPHTVSLSGSQMTSSRLVQAARGKRVVHFATHGLLDPQEPLAGGLAAFDRLVTVADIFGWRLDARLAVLSACETGKITRGEEYVGLTRAFQAAGTQSMVVTLWSVADQPTATWMNEFYAQLARGARLSRAHQQATLATRRRFTHPYFWAPCALWGDGAAPL